MPAVWPERSSAGRVWSWGADPEGPFRELWPEKTTTSEPIRTNIKYKCDFFWKVKHSSSKKRTSNTDVWLCWISFIIWKNMTFVLRPVEKQRQHLTLCSGDWSEVLTTAGSLVEWRGSAHFGVKILVSAVAVVICSHFLPAVLVIDCTCNDLYKKKQRQMVSEDRHLNRFTSPPLLL